MTLKKQRSGSAEEAVTQKRTRAVKGLAGLSLFVFLLDKLSNAIHNTLLNGFFGRIFTAYPSELSAYENGEFVAYFRGDIKKRSFFRKIREFLSRNFETSFILKKLRKSVCGLAFVPLKAYGSFFMAFGIYTMIVYIIKSFLPITGVADISYLYAGICVCLASLPLCFSRQSLAKAVQHNKIPRFLFVENFGYREESFSNKSIGSNKKGSFAILWGLLGGILTFFISPLNILAFIAISTVVSLVIITPEIGVLICIFCTPLFSFVANPTLLLAALVAITSFSYIIKIVRGKRIFKLELVDFAVLLFMLITFFSGSITTGGKASYYSAIISCVLMFGYFLVVNLIRTDAWVKRCINALVSSGVIVAIIGVGQYILGYSKNDWIDRTYFTDINGRTTALFENPNYLAAYLTIVFPFALYLTFNAKNKKERLLLLISDLFIILCTIFTWSRGAWLAMLISAIILCIIYTRKTARFIWAAIVAIPFLPFVLPKNIVSRFMSIGNLADSSTMYRVYTWRGSIEMIRDYFWGGIGYGTETFTQLYPLYAYSGIEAAAHSHNLYLQILIGMGIGGLICFAMIVILYAQKSFSYFSAPSSTNSFMIAAAALLSVVALLIMGMFDYVWYNYRIFFLFWVVMALGIACIKIGNRELSKNDFVTDNDEYAAVIDIDA